MLDKSCFSMFCTVFCSFNHTFFLNISVWVYSVTETLIVSLLNFIDN